MTDALHAIELAVEALRRGQVVGVPTDTVYGLAVDPHDPEALERLYAIKRRRPDVPVAVLVADTAQAASLGRLEPEAMEAVDRSWPGALTIVVRRTEGCPAHLGDPDRDTIGVRAPDQPEIQALLRAFGPLAVSSANRSGEPPAGSVEEARAVFGDEVATYVEGLCVGDAASTVVDLTVDPPQVLRTGPVPWGDA